MTSEDIRIRLHQTVKSLPQYLATSEKSVMRDWTTHLPLRHQGVLVTAIRGCDHASKEDSSKSLTRMIRRAILNPAALCYAFDACLRSYRLQTSRSEL